MRVALSNQENPNIATAQIEVGCGIDGDEGNEPSFTYTINADGVAIHQMSDNGETQGHVALSLEDLNALCGLPYLSTADVAAAQARLFPCVVESAPDEVEVLVPVRTKDGTVDFRPIAQDHTGTFCIVIVASKAGVLETTDPNGDRVFVGAVTVDEAIGKVLRANPSLSYNDIEDHMEV